MKQKIQKYKSIDLFAGIGGIRLGFDQAFDNSIETVFVSEWDEFAQKTYKANFHDDLEIAGDITKIDEKIFPISIFALRVFLVRHLVLRDSVKVSTMIIKECREERFSSMWLVFVRNTSRK